MAEKVAGDAIIPTKSSCETANQDSPTKPMKVGSTTEPTSTITKTTAGLTKKDGNLRVLAIDSTIVITVITKGIAVSRAPLTQNDVSAVSQPT